MLVREEFRSWLVSREPDKTVGKSNSPMDCPVSTYLQQLTGETCIVGSESWRIVRFLEAPAMDDMYERALPDWARKFVNEIDSYNRGGALSDEWFKGISAKAALTVLDSID